MRYLTDPSGVITDTFTYDAFGILIHRQARTSGGGGVLVPFANPALETAPANTSPTVNNYRYTGEQWDQDLGMYYLRARYYRPELGRFWTRDSYEGNNQDPLSLHKYIYCSENPVGNIDPTGHSDLSVGFLFSATTIRTGLMEFEVDGVHGDRWAVSGENARGNSVSPVSTPVLETSSPYCTEPMILEDLIANVIKGNGIGGTMGGNGINGSLGLGASGGNALANSGITLGTH